MMGDNFLTGFAAAMGMGFVAFLSAEALGGWLRRRTADRLIDEEWAKRAELDRRHAR